MENIIEIEDLHFSYKGDSETPDVEVLKGIDLTIKKGEFVAVLGHNGSENPHLPNTSMRYFSPQRERCLLTV